MRKSVYDRGGCGNSSNAGRRRLTDCTEPPHRHATSRPGKLIVARLRNNASNSLPYHRRRTHAHTPLNTPSSATNYSIKPTDHSTMQLQ